MMATSSKSNFTSKLYPERRNCKYPGCSNKIQNGGVCFRHGAKAQMCIHPCCSNRAVNSGVCRRHGAGGRTCGHANCKNFAIKGGVYRRHGSVAKICGHTGCTNNSRRFGVCSRHGAYRNHSSSHQLTRGTTITRHCEANTCNSQGEEVKAVNHFYNVSQTILDLGMENFHPLKFSEMSTTLLSLEHELSTILRDCGISSFV